MINHPHHLAARPVVFRDTDGMARLISRQPHRACAKARHTHRNPSPRGMIIAGCSVQRDACTGREFIADNEGREELLVILHPFGLAEGGKGR